MSTRRRELDLFGAFVARTLGLHFDESRASQLEEALLRRAGDAGYPDAGAYLAALSSSDSREEARAIAELLTVGETYFFRNSEQFRALAEVALPARAAAGASSVRILSAGCASGEEPYTISIIAREAAAPLILHAMDVNPAAIARARRAVYSPWSLRETTGEMKQRYFRPAGKDFRLADEIRREVHFDEANLAQDDPRFWRPASWDIIFCRNVIMYFRPETQKAVVARLAASLVPGGFLFLGHAETLRGLSQDFHLCQSHDTFYYQLRERGTDPEPAAARFTDESPARALALASALEDGAPSWMEAIRSASERIASLSGASHETADAQRQRSAGRERERILELVGREKFGEALEALSGLPGAAEADADTGLMKAALLVNAGNPREAERVCAAVLKADDLSAGAHYVMAQCREAAGDGAGAAEHDRAAAYLDPTFAMPRLHLGLLLRKAGDAAGAIEQFQGAFALLPAEDASRLLLFGGGFGREALMQLCQAETKACEGRKA
ncbi:MAG: protein-glutamate O-methyltransferase CheR [Planctomycetia bacterium]|nr:protein-glutamate O-methyltransferase CheR [Planctomycetia bacterium]